MTNKITKRKKQDGRSTDLTFQWFINIYGKEWEGWRQLGEEWIKQQDKGINSKLDALCLFFEIYLAQSISWTSDVLSFFIGMNGWTASTDELKKIILEKTNRSNVKSMTDCLNYIFTFIEWILDEHFSENRAGRKVRLYANPLEKVTSRGHRSETVHNPLPYRYICDLRQILCPEPNGHFSDWKWAHAQTGQGHQGGSWFEVDESQIDKLDADCVWRKKVVTRNRKKCVIHQIWSPVASMVLFIKLHLPLRTYQVRMLDSGEADKHRYENGNWAKNSHPFTIKHRNKGVFRRFKDQITGFDSTGLYINTNKTADLNKDEFERGYEIPWQHEIVLYWLEKLRNWQEKYNPITEPTDCLTLENKHTNDTKSPAYLSAMGQICFLFRNASASELINKHKPVIETAIVTLWYKLLQQLENDLLKSGDTLSDGTPLRLVHDYGEYYKKSKKKTEFPLHSLRVSLITCYIMDAKLPLPVVSKILAGHSRLLMTIYYTKITPTVMNEKMLEANELLDTQSKESIRVFLKDAELRQIQSKMAYKDEQSIENALVNRNPLGWEKRHHGLCLAGGNTVLLDECKTVAGCWNGGEVITEPSVSNNGICGPVPHGPENCVRCRWFITDARYLPALNAHLNFMSYKANEAANLATKLEDDLEQMEELKYQAEIDEKPFTKHNEIQALQRRYEKQIVEADEYIRDWIATFGLIRRLIEIERNRAEIDTTNKIVAVGSKDDIKVGLMETTSELLHLSLLCEDAEIFPDMLDELKKTSVIQERTLNLSRIMLRKGYTPHLLMLDEYQQLISANAMIRQMATQANPIDKLDGFKQVANYLELGQFMEDSKLLDCGMSVLDHSKNNFSQGISIKSLSHRTEKGVFLNVD